MISFTGLQNFNADLDAFAKKLGIARQTVYRRVSLELWNGITKRTPVDTGRARSSWNLAIGKPDSFVPAGLIKGTGAHKDDSSPPTEPSAGPPDVSKVDGTEVVWITSNLDYIEALENGHSKQAPRGMVMITVIEVVAKIQLLMEESK